MNAFLSFEYVTAVSWVSSETSWEPDSTFTIGLAGLFFIYPKALFKVRAVDAKKCFSKHGLYTKRHNHAGAAKKKSNGTLKMDDIYYLAGGGTLGVVLSYNFPKYRMHMVVVALVAGGFFWYNMDPDKKRR